MTPARLFSGLLSLAAVALILTPTQSLAGFSTSIGQTQYGDSTSSLGYAQGSPLTVNRTGVFNGMSYDLSYQSYYSVSQLKSTVGEDYKFKIGGDPFAGHEIFRAQAISIAVATLEYSGLQLPGYNEFFYASSNGLLKYHLAEGDTLTYNVVLDITDNENRAPLFEKIFSGTNNVAGDYKVDLSVPDTFVIDLLTLKQRSQVNLQSVYFISVKLDRGPGDREASVVDFDPGVGVVSVPNTAANATPAPTSLTLVFSGIIFWSGYRALRRQRPGKAVML